MHLLKKSYLFVLGIIGVQGVIIASFQFVLIKNCKKWDMEEKAKEKNLSMISEDIMAFPIPLSYQNEIYYEDTYGGNGRNGMHEGRDIMDKKNKSGRIPVLSATDGIITNIGWLYLGGYRIGITSENNIYYYYAHLYSFAGGLKVGKEVKAGELIGFMGDTGEGEEGTTGKFDVHLHFGIYLFPKNQNEETVNPYPFLQKFDRQ